MIIVGLSTLNRPYTVGVNLQVGDTVYGDRSYTYTSVPTSVQGGSHIQTANNDKGQTGNPFLTFTLDQPSIVYVAHDARMTPKPSWLNTFTDTGEVLVTSDTTLQLFNKTYPAGPVELGSNESGGAFSMYTVVIQLAPQEEPVPEPEDSILCQLLSVCESIPPAVWTSCGKSKPFRVFDGTLYAGKPDMASYGLQPIISSGAGLFTPASWWADPTVLPDQASVESVMNGIVEPTTYLDIEHWDVKSSREAAIDSVIKYLTVLSWAKAARPDLVVGYYAAPPVRDYWRARKSPTDPEHIAWVEENTRMLPLAAMVDVLFPSLYTFYEDQTGWVEYAVANIAEARRLSGGKPVYAFLWPQYSNASLQDQYMPADFWRLQLNTVKAHADGVVIWGGWVNNVGRAPWDEQAPWWVETKEFLGV